MELTGKIQRQLQIHLKTLKRTYGTNLKQFSLRFTTLFGHPRTTRNNTASTLGEINVHRVVGTFIESVSRHQLHLRCSAPEIHTGELGCIGATSMLSTLPKLVETDVFDDVGSGIGNSITQAALESEVGKCVRVEVQCHLVWLALSYIQTATGAHSRLGNRSIYRTDICTMADTTWQTLQPATVVFANNIVFNPQTISALDLLVTSLPALVHISLMCWRHPGSCKREFCSVWQLQNVIQLNVLWFAKPHQAYCGVRQRCPLAPLLFILALEPFYRLVEATATITGIPQRAGERCIILKITGYADATAIYLRTPSEFPHILLLTEGFGATTGLMVNAKKTVIIALCRTMGYPSITLPGDHSLYKLQLNTVATSALKLEVETSCNLRGTKRPHSSFSGYVLSWSSR
ncbi:unnamed protein product [Phytophthora fragariaefolia]|uniref:Unnamed protein product n=1 Tax=Phytophthora fragariaefolia TaxID=1490495 RepID=A0A9W6YI48_9STRA|nr:unnamed protein product [Phytophthora fragariaefolia]